MYSEDDQFLATPIPVKIGDKEFRMSPLTDKDLSELDLWARRQYLAPVREALKDIDDREMRRELWLDATEHAITLSFSRGMGAKLMASLDGMSMLAYVMARKCHEDVTESTFRKLVVDAVAVRAVRQAFSTLNKVHETGTSEDNGAKKKESSAANQPSTKP